MTLSELATLLRPKLIFIIAIPIACFIVVFLGMTLLVKPTYSATSKLQVDQSLSTVKVIVDNAAAEVASAYSSDGVAITTKSDSTNVAVSITVTGNSDSACINAANETVQRSVTALDASNPKITKRVVQATSATKTSASPLKYSLVAALAALFIVVCAIVVMDMMKRRIHSWQSVEEAAELPCLGTLGGSASDRERLFLNIRLAGREDEALPDTVCIMPVGETRAAEEAAQQLSSMKARRPLAAHSTPSVSQSSRPVLKALGADIVVLAVEGEVSTFNDLEETLRALAIAKVAPVGFLFAKAGTATQSPLASDKGPRKKHTRPAVDDKPVGHIASNHAGVGHVDTGNASDDQAKAPSSHPAPTAEKTAETDDIRG